MEILSYEALQARYKEFLYSHNFSKTTIDSVCTDTFYLWRKGSKELFWSTVVAVDFQNIAPDILRAVLIKNSTGNIPAPVSGYLYALRKFREFLLSEQRINPLNDQQQSTAKSNEVKREIIINKMYTGGYLTEGDNIGHEIINLYKADDGKHYIYLNSQGTIELSHRENKITVLLVRKFAPNVYKVLAKAEGITILDCADSKLSRKQRYQKQVDLGLTYNGVNLVDLFHVNTYGGSFEEDKNVYTTFAAEYIFKPKNQLYLTDHEAASNAHTFFIRTSKGFGKQTLREFYHEHKKPDAFADLNQVIADQELWQDNDMTQAISNLSECETSQTVDFLKIIRQEDNELVFSNLFAHFFKINQVAFVKFASEVLMVEIQPDFIIEREKKNIDLLISDRSNVIVIENKIKSGINGISDKEDSNHQMQSQLTKYYQFVTTDQNYCKKKVKCFLFLPNYHHIALHKFSFGEEYTVIYYRKIYNFFIENSTLFTQVPYFEEFLHALYRHTKDYENDLEEEMQRKFQNIIGKVKRANKQDH